MRRYLALGTLVVLAVVASACGSGGESGSGDTLPDVSIVDEGPVQEGGVVRVGVGSEADSWNPVVAQWSGHEYIVANAIFDPLMAYDAEYQPRPYLAESMEPNEDFTVWTITLRPGIAR